MAEARRRSTRSSTRRSGWSNAAPGTCPTAVAEQPWLPNGPIPTARLWSATGHDGRPRRSRVAGTTSDQGPSMSSGRRGRQRAQWARRRRSPRQRGRAGHGARSRGRHRRRHPHQSLPASRASLQDECSAVHMMAVGSRAVRRARAGGPRAALVPSGDRPRAPARWRRRRRAVPLGGGTADGLGPDGGRWRRLFGRPSETFDEWGEDIMGPLLRLPRHPLALARFGIPTLVPAALLARVFSTERAQGAVHRHSRARAPAACTDR